MSATTSHEHIELPVEGMTCASCVARVEKSLNHLDGVDEATVNLATHSAAVSFDPSQVATDQLVAAVEELGYRVPAVPALPHDGDDAHHDGAHEGNGHHGSHHGGHDHLQHAQGADHRVRLWVSSVLAVPAVVLSMVPALQFDFWQWVVLALATPVVTWGAWPFHRATFVNLRHRATTMDTLVSLGVTAAYLWSLYALVWGDAGMRGMEMSFDLTPARGAGADEIYLEVAAGVTLFLLAGRHLEGKATRRAGSALRALLSLGAKRATVVGPDGAEREVPVDELQVGDRFVVRPGEKVATDGVVEHGTSAIDASLLTGESLPVDVGPGDQVIGATVSSGGRLVVRATRVGRDTQLAQMGRLLKEAQTGKAPIQRLADRISAVFVPVVLVIAVVTLAAWLATGHSGVEAFTAAVAVLIIACPCALGLATPTALMAGSGRGAQIGVLIRGPQVLESTRRVDTVVLDKTGTVTAGEMELVDVVVDPDAGVDAQGALVVAGALEAASEHPIARALTAAARDRVGSLPEVDAFQSDQGLGVRGTVEGLAVVAGRQAFLVDAGLAVGDALVAAREQAEAVGRTAVLVGWGGRARAVLVVADRVKPTSADAVRGLKELGLTPVLLTGDNEGAARAVAAEVGIDEVQAEVRPADKVATVRDLQARGRVVAMVGDGVNDAAALARADLGLAMGTGTDVAIEASDLTLVRGDLRAAVDAIRLSRRTLGTIKANLFWAFAYNVAAIPAAALGYLNPLIAGAAMAFSSVFVVTNSLRLFRFRSVVR